MAESDTPAAKRVKTDAAGGGEDAQETPKGAKKGNGKIAFVTGITGQVSSRS